MLRCPTSLVTCLVLHCTIYDPCGTRQPMLLWSFYLLHSVRQKAGRNVNLLMLMPITFASIFRLGRLSLPYIGVKVGERWLGSIHGYLTYTKCIQRKSKATWVSKAVHLSKCVSRPFKHFTLRVSSFEKAEITICVSSTLSLALVLYEHSHGC